MPQRHIYVHEVSRRFLVETVHSIFSRKCMVGRSSVHGKEIEEHVFRMFHFDVLGSLVKYVLGALYEGRISSSAPPVGIFGGCFFVAF